MKRSWRTTATGIVAAICGVLAMEAPNKDVREWAALGSSVCVAVMGFVARDEKVTSEQAGAK